MESEIYRGSPVITRYPEPILTKDDVPYEPNLTFNAGIVKTDDGYLMLFRNDYGCTKEEWESGKINAGLVAIRDELGSGASPRIRMVYFVPDGKKEGGGYRSVTASVRKIDEYLRILILENGLKVSFDNIGSLELQKPGT